MRLLDRHFLDKQRHAEFYIQVLSFSRLTLNYITWRTGLIMFQQDHYKSV